MSRLVGIDIRSQIPHNGHMNSPDETEVMEQTVQDVYCPKCDLTFIEVDVSWWSTGVGEAECPECETLVDVPLPEPDFYRDDQGVWKC